MNNKKADLICIKHTNQRVASINFENYNDNNVASRLLCSSCLIDLLNQNQKERNYQLVDIDEFWNNPTIQLQRVMKNDGIKTFSDLDYLQQFEKEINLIEDRFKLTIIGLRTCVKEIRNLKDKFWNDFQEDLKLDSLRNLYDRTITSLDINQIKQQVKLFEEHLNFVSQNLIQAKCKANQNMIKNQDAITNTFQNHLKDIMSDIKRLQEVSIDTFDSNNHQGLPISIYGDLKDFSQIHYRISEGKQIQYQLLYQGSKDGFNLLSYQTKCYYQSHLLTIITTKHGKKFGCYSPCQILKEDIVIDQKLKSFLFKFDGQEIYKLKDQRNAFYFRYPYCRFGESDLVFDGNFTKFSSNIGNSYDISNYNVMDRSTHLFGESNPQIQEFKVYKVLFQ